MALPLSGTNRKSMLGWPSTNFSIKTAPNSGTLMIPHSLVILLTPECGIIECLAALAVLGFASVLWNVRWCEKWSLNCSAFVVSPPTNPPPQTLHLPLKITPDSTIKELIIGEAFTQQEIESLEASQFNMAASIIGTMIIATLKFASDKDFCTKSVYRFDVNLADKIQGNPRK